MTREVSSETRSDESPDLGRLPTLARPFLDITEDHEDALETIHGELDKFAKRAHEGGAPPCNVIGPYRTGKTQFLYHVFNESWKRGIPAVFIPDPGELLDRFEAADEEMDLSEWLFHEAKNEIEAIAGREFGDARWVPDVPEYELEEWAETIDINWEDAADTDRFVILVDEVEQHFQRLADAVDVEDANPLRTLSDGLPDTFFVWSFGLLSAYEFVGDADRGRVIDIRIPPVGIADVQRLLKKHEQPLELTTTIWWAARGRAAWVFKLITELDGDELNNLPDWLDELSENKFAELDMVRPIWAEPGVPYEEGAKAVAGQPDGYTEWISSEETAISAADMRDVLHGILEEPIESRSGPTKATKQEANQMLRRTLTKTIESLADHNQYVPQFWLSDPPEAEAFLALAQNLLASFEPRSDGRSLAYEVLESSKDVLSNEYLPAVAQEVDTESRSVTIPKPSIIQRAYPPLVMNPRRLTDFETHVLEQEMERGVAVNCHESVRVVFCPTQDTLYTELNELTQQPDVSEPVVFFRPDDVEVDLESFHGTLQKNDLLDIREAGTSRIWDFVVQLYGYAKVVDGAPKYDFDQPDIHRFTEEAENREIATTLETLYEQLSTRVGAEAANGLWQSYTQRFGTHGEELFWSQHPIVEPQWTNAPLGEETITLSLMLAMGEKLDSGRDQIDFAPGVVAALDQDLISANSFNYTEFVRNGFTQSGFSTSINQLWDLHREQESESLRSEVRNMQSLLGALADNSKTDTNKLRETLQNPSTKASQGGVSVIGQPELKEYEIAWLRAALTARIVESDDAIVDRLEELAAELDTYHSSVADHIAAVEEVSEELGPPDGHDIGSSLELAPGYLEQYRENIDTVRSALRDAATRAQSAPGFRTTAYVLAQLAQRYVDLIGDKVQALPTDVINLSDISSTRALHNTYLDIYRDAEDFEAADEYFDSQDELLAAIEAFGKEAFDFRTHAGGSQHITLPDENGVLPDIDQTARAYQQKLQSYYDHLDELVDNHEQLVTVRTGTSEEMTAFLEDAASWEGDKE